MLRSPKLPARPCAGTASMRPAAFTMTQPEAASDTPLPRKAPLTVTLAAWIAKGPAVATVSVTTVAPVAWIVMPPATCCEPKISVS